LKPEIVIVHFGDIGKYPPAFNLVRYFANAGYFGKIVVCSRTDFNETLNKVIWCNTVNREKNNRIIRLLSYLLFYSKTFWCLLFQQPQQILYYETLSFPPVYWYKKIRRLFNKTTLIYCHYHEYTTSEEYNRGMKLAILAHGWENKSYSNFCWISHTNSDRAAFFLKDHPKVNPLKLHVLPNYPPLSWKEIVKSRDENAGDYPLKIIYVGSLDLESMYTREFAQWVILQKGKVHWDIYSGQLHENTRRYLKDLQSSYINFKGSIFYNNLPSILINYDVGVILYKGVIPNYVYNAPNKLFEYSVCGLDVWFPKEMSGSIQYKTSDTYPKVIDLNFQSLDLLDISTLIDREKLQRKEHNYYLEDVLPELLNAIVEG